MIAFQIIKIVVLFAFIIIVKTEEHLGPGTDDQKDNYGYYTVHEEKELFFDWNTEVKVCGSTLADMLSSVCHGKYNEVKPGHYKTKEQRISEGPVTLCCHQYCQISSLKEYCMDPRIKNDFLIFKSREPYLEKLPAIFIRKREDPKYPGHAKVQHFYGKIIY